MIVLDLGQHVAFLHFLIEIGNLLRLAVLVEKRIAARVLDLILRVDRARDKRADGDLQHRFDRARGVHDRDNVARGHLGRLPVRHALLLPIVHRRLVASRSGRAENGDNDGKDDAACACDRISRFSVNLCTCHVRQMIIRSFGEWLNQIDIGDLVENIVALIELRDVWKIYDLGEVKVEALRGSVARTSSRANTWR